MSVQQSVSPHGSGQLSNELISGKGENVGSSAEGVIVFLVALGIAVVGVALAYEKIFL